MAAKRHCVAWDVQVVHHTEGARPRSGPEPVLAHAVELVDGVPTEAAVCGQPVRALGHSLELDEDLDWIEPLPRSMVPRCLPCRQSVPPRPQTWGLPS